MALATNASFILANISLSDKRSIYLFANKEVQLEVQLISTLICI